jgi:hypothetical protein
VLVLAERQGLEVRCTKQCLSHTNTHEEPIFGIAQDQDRRISVGTHVQRR